MSFAEIANYYLIAINFAAFVAFGYDKVMAESGGWRVSEDSLVTFVIAGGIIGALAGRTAFRHKTRKASFTRKLWTGFAIHVLLVAAVAAFVLTDDGSRPGGGHVAAFP